MLNICAGKHPFQLALPASAFCAVTVPLVGFGIDVIDAHDVPMVDAVCLRLGWACE
jgi:hypothetical protein